MADATDPRLIRVPGPLPGGATWTKAALLEASAALATPVGDGHHLLLPADPKGSFSLDCVDGSLGRLTLPRMIAVDHRFRVYLLDQSGKRVLRYDAAATVGDPKRPFVPLPGIGNVTGPCADANDPRRIGKPTAFAVDRHSLYLADSESPRVLVFGLDSLTLRDVWCFNPTDRLRDVVVAGDRVFVLVENAVYVYRAGDSRPRLLFRSDFGVTWSRAAVDTSGLLYLLTPRLVYKPAQLQVFDPDQPERNLKPVTDPAVVRDRFPFPALYSIPDESLDPPQYVMPGSLARGCGRAWPEPLPNRTVEVSLTRLPPTAGKLDGGFVFGADGVRIEPSKVRPARTPLYAKGAISLQPTDSAANPDLRGVWVSRPLDSKLFRCRWDTIELEFADLPAGATATVQTYTTDEEQTDEEQTREEIQGLPEEAWIDGLVVTGTNRNPASDPRLRTDFLVDGPPGRFLFLRIRFHGDGFVTPVLSQAVLHFPRRSYLEQLPAVFSEDEQSRRFLERFLAVFQAEWDRLEDGADTIAGLFDPAAVPASHLDYLAGWFGVKLENGWPAAARRQLLEKLPGLLFARRPNGEDRPGGTRRGTPVALREFIAAILPTLAGDDHLDTGGLPLVIEGFRERDYRLIAAACATDALDLLPAAAPDGPVASTAGPTPELFGPERLGRFQLGATSTLDEGKLLPTETPDLDLFTEHAHRFRVVVPEVWVRGPAAEAALRRVIDAEKPAHTAYCLELIGPWFRVGVQSTVGVDTILAGPQQLRLGDPAVPGAVLGSLGQEPTRNAGPIRLLPGARLGVDAVRL